MARLSDRVVTGAPNGILANDEPIQWYAADGITLIDGIKVDATDAVYLAPAGGPTEVGGDLDVTGDLNVGSGTSTAVVVNSDGGVGSNYNGIQYKNDGAIVGGSLWLEGEGAVRHYAPDGSVLYRSYAGRMEVNGDLTVTDAGIAAATISATGTGGANQAVMKFYNEGAFKGQIGYREASDDFEIWSQNGSLPTITMDVGNNVSIPNGDLDVDGGLRVSGDQATPLTNEGLYGGHPSRGAYIQGHGSANDFTVANQTGSIALAVPQNTINVEARGNLDVSGVLTVAGNISGPNSVLMSSDTAEVIRVIRTGSNAGSAELSTAAGYGSVVLTDGSGTVQKVKAFGNEMRFDNGSTTLMTLNTTGLAVAGALSKGSGSFRIDHPLKPETHQLVHSFTESPQADLLYSGTSDLVDGAAEINLDEFHGMTEGTFVALNRNIRVFTTNESDWEPIKGSVTGNILSISCQDASCSDKVSWMVIGERQDKHMMNTEWTDEQGRVIVEPLKPEVLEEAGAE